MVDTHMQLKDIFPEISKAIEENDVARLDTLFKENTGSIDLLTPFGSWLHYAANKSSVATLKALVDFGIDPGIRVDPIDEDVLSDKGMSAIVIAARAGDIDNFKYFMQCNVALDTHTSTANPLFGAILGRSIEMARLLIAAGIDTTVRYSGERMNNMDALAFALERGETEIADVIALHQTNGDVKKAEELKAERHGKGRHGRPPVSENLAPPS